MAILKKKAEKDVKAAVADAPKAEEKKETKRGPLAKEHAGASYRILMKPVFSEKSARQEAKGKYTFLIAPDANKTEVLRAVRDLYGVQPVSVRIVLKKGKNVRFGQTQGREKDEKKAIVTPRAGDSITVSEA